MTRLMDGDDSFMQMEMYMKVNGMMTNEVDREFTSIKMVRDTRDHLKMESITDIVLRHGQMDRDMKVSMLMERSMAKVVFNGEMALITMEISLRTIFKELESTTGPMAGIMREVG